MVLSVKHLTKVYGTQQAIDQIQFEVKQGEVLGFLGPNGAGKSTTMKIITTFLSPTSGSVELPPYTLAAHPQEFRKRIGYLPEHNPLYLDMYVWEFLTFMCKVYRIPKKLRDERITSVIGLTGLEREQHKQIQMLSKGYRQRVGIAQALLHDPEVLILDEPTTGLDPNQIIEIRNLIREIGKTKAVIFSTHILSEAEAIADRILIIHQGKIVANEATAALTQTASTESRVWVEFEQAGFDPTPLRNLEGILALQARGERSWEILTKADTDIRPALFNLAVAQKQVILTLQRKVFTLEDIFRNLTQAAG